MSGRIKAEILVAGPAAHGVGRQPGRRRRPDRMQDRQHRQPRLHRRRGDHRGPARRPVRDRARALRRGAGHPPIQDRDRGQPRHRRVLRARQGDDGQDRPTPSARKACARRCSRCSRGVDATKVAPAAGSGSEPRCRRRILMRRVAGGGRRRRGRAACWRRARSCSSRATWPGAIAAFDEAAKVDPKDARPHYLKGVALEKKGDTPRRDDRLQGGDRAQGRLRRGAQQPGRADAREERPAGRRGRVRGRP